MISLMLVIPPDHKIIEKIVQNMPLFESVEGLIVNIFSEGTGEGFGIPMDGHPEEMVSDIINHLNADSVDTPTLKKDARTQFTYTFDFIITALQELEGGNPEKFNICKKINEKVSDEMKKDVEKQVSELEKKYSSGCFIATAAFGTPLAEEINILRGWKDKTLLTNPFGRLFVRFYYRVSPPIAKLISKSEKSKRAVRFLVKKLLFILDQMTLK